VCVCEFHFPDTRSTSQLGGSRPPGDPRKSRMECDIVWMSGSRESCEHSIARSEQAQNVGLGDLAHDLGVDNNALSPLLHQDMTT